MSKYLALLAGVLAAASVSAGGDNADSMRSADEKFELLDADQNSAISMSEASEDQNLAATFSAVDADGDGEVSQTEYTAHLAESGEHEQPSATSQE
jgi:Ca2+-binding EF-hand superfamily protein